MAVASSPVGFEGKSQSCDTPNSVPLTPTKVSESLTATTDANGHGFKTPNSSLRERRGRRNINNGSFRPLSIFTKSLLLPFDLDVEKGLEILKGDSPDRSKEAGIAVSSGHKRLKMTDKEQCERASFVSSQNASPSLSVGSMEDPFNHFQNGEMDLMTALKVTSPEKDMDRNICANFAILCELPAPEYSQHPAFAADPFKTTSEAPILSTLTSISEIKWFNPKVRRSAESSTRSGRDSLERKRSFFGLELKTPTSAKSRNAFNASGGQSSSSFSTNSTVPSPPKNAPFASASEPVLTKEDSNASHSARTRKFSDRFKSKTSPEQSEPTQSTWSPTALEESPNLNRQDLERYVRRTTNTPTYDYDPTSPYPRHPNTGRGWKSRNLKCTNCIEHGCACCGRTCCAFRAAVLALDVHLEGTAGRTLALHRIQEITKLYPYGKEVPTFLQCTAGMVGDGMGCGKQVCPDCCSICPDEACGDTQCRTCKPEMWEECIWHKGVSFL